MQRSDINIKIIIGFILCALVLAVYWNTQKFDFINYDDQTYVTENNQTQAGFTFHIFQDISTANWHPLTMISHTLDWFLFEDKAGGHHWTNVILHILNAVLLFLLLNVMTGSVWRSATVAALFAVHPINVESVAWVAERKNVLSTFFWFLTMLFYVWYVRKPGWKRYLPVFGCFALGLMSKPMLVTLPFTLLLLDYWPLNRMPLETKGVKAQAEGCATPKTKWGFLIYEKIPLFILTAVFINITLYTQKAIGAVISVDFLPLGMRVKNAVIAYGEYVKKMFWPLDLSVFYPRYEIEVWRFLLVLFLLILMTAISIRFFRNRPYFTVGWLWFLGTLVPVIGLVQVGAQAMADRYAYVPFTGLFVMVVWWVHDAVKKNKYKRPVLIVLSVVILSVFSVISWQRCQLWGDKFALWNDVLKNHKVAFAYNMRGLAYASESQHDLALNNYNAALQVDRKFDAALINRGNLYAETGREEDALKDYTEAIGLNARSADALYNRGLLHLKSKRLDNAIADFDAAIKINPDMADYYNNRGAAFHLNGEYARAMDDFNKALSINRLLSEAYFNKGMLYYMHKEYKAAVLYFTEAVILKPRYMNAHIYRGLSFVSLGMNEYAIRDFKRALSIDGKNIDALYHLADVLKTLKRYRESSAYLKQILLIRPGDKKALKAAAEVEQFQK